MLNIGDLIIFKKTGKQWHYGKIVGNVNDRSYIVRDSFDNYFRRNRRFIAKTKNDDFSASDLMYEENVKMGHLDNLPEIQIVKPANEQVIVESGNSSDNNYNMLNEENEPTPIIVSTDESETSSGSENEISTEYETAGGDDSDVSDHGVRPELEVQLRTRSGRIVRPPKRYGY